MSIPFQLGKVGIAGLPTLEQGLTDLPDLPDIWWTYIERYKILNIKGRGFSKIGIFARNTIGFLMVFTAAPNTSYKNARKKQNTRRYTLEIKVSDVCWVGGGGGN